jgi:hypothetical protein
MPQSHVALPSSIPVVTPFYLSPTPSQVLSGFRMSLDPQIKPDWLENLQDV